ncbi:MAG: DUF1836 domain-containing protein [Clostridia bacterium]|nr:DUF1836 domain-containing protein [Clostridia bacterium]
MIRQLPGTTVKVEIKSADEARALLGNMFIAGGLVLSQISALTALEPYMVQNWIQRRFLASPVRKRYSMDQFCRIATINALRGVLQIDKITALISYVNGALDDDSDNILPDSMFYIYFIAALSAAEERRAGPFGASECVEAAVSGFKEPYEGAKERLTTSLSAMVNAYYAAEMLKDVDLTVRRIAESR